MNVIHLRPRNPRETNCRQWLKSSQYIPHKFSNSLCRLQMCMSVTQIQINWNQIYSLYYALCMTSNRKDNSERCWTAAYRFSEVSYSLVCQVVMGQGCLIGPDFPAQSGWMDDRLDGWQVEWHSCTSSISTGNRKTCGIYWDVFNHCLHTVCFSGMTRPKVNNMHGYWCILSTLCLCSM